MLVEKVEAFSFFFFLFFFDGNSRINGGRVWNVANNERYSVTIHVTELEEPSNLRALERRGFFDPVAHFRNRKLNKRIVPPWGKYNLGIFHRKLFGKLYLE